jgi:two-component system LytT family response regulator
LFLLRHEDIAYIQADREYACIFFANGNKEDVFERLGEIEKKLPQKTFLRTGKSVIINRKYIYKIANTTLLLATPSVKYSVEISKEAMRQLKEILN